MRFLQKNLTKALKNDQSEYIFPHNLFVLFLLKESKEIVSMSSIQIKTNAELNVSDIDQFRATLPSCSSHENCTTRLFSLDTYCCKSTNYCCNWFEFMMKFK